MSAPVQRLEGRHWLDLSKFWTPDGEKTQRTTPLVNKLLIQMSGELSQSWLKGSITSVQEVIQYMNNVQVLWLHPDRKCPPLCCIGGFSGIFLLFTRITWTSLMHSFSWVLNQRSAMQWCGKTEGGVQILTPSLRTLSRGSLIGGLMESWCRPVNQHGLSQAPLLKVSLVLSHLSFLITLEVEELEEMPIAADRPMEGEKHL